MLRITDVVHLEPIYDYQIHLQTPYFFSADYESWKASYEHDADGEGRPLFKQLYGKAAYDGDALVGFIQYGNTALGFDELGDISLDVSYPVIRSLYFDQGQEEAGCLLLQEAMHEFEAEPKIYAFFHYFGMSCFARHGKLFERYGWIQDLLYRFGFVIEHENVYYSAKVQAGAGGDVQLIAHARTKGDQQTFDLLLNQQQIGGCELHYPDAEGNAFLRWIYVNKALQDQGIGSQCMAALKAWLQAKGITRLDTDTALENHRAQRYYEKNGFIKKGITRSYFRVTPLP